MNKRGCIALQIYEEERITMAHYMDELQEQLGHALELIYISRPIAYPEYEPYVFARSLEEFTQKAKALKADI